MNIYLNLENSQLQTEHNGKGSSTQRWEGVVVGQNSHGIYQHTSFEVEEWLNVERFTISEKFLEKLIRLECAFSLYRDHGQYELERTLGIYEEGEVRIVVLPNKGGQRIEVTATSLTKLKQVLADLRDGKLVPKYPLTRPQNAPTYEKLAAMVSIQSHTIDLLNDKLAFANKVVNHAQDLVLEAGDACRKLCKVGASLDAELAQVG